jgi:DNA mismatch repair protein MutS2
MTPSERIPEKTRVELEWPALLDELARRTATERGRAAALELPFLESAEAARGRMAEIDEARALIERNEEPSLGGIRAIDPAIGALEHGEALDAPEIVDVAATIVATSRLARHLAERAAAAPRLAALGATLPDLASLADPIVAAFDEACRLRDDASPQLGRLRREVTRLEALIARRMGELLRDPKIEPCLQDRFFTQREGRYVLPVRLDAPGRVPGIVHATSQSGQTLFVEPAEIVETNNRHRIALDGVAREERRILAEFCALLGERTHEIRRAADGAAHVDLVFAAARLAGDLGASTPAVLDEGDLELPQARHPLLALTPNCVASRLELPRGTILILSGPNAGGKTVALKAVGLAALMVRAGLPVCGGEGAKMPWYHAVWTDISDDQSIARSLSTFSAHLLHLRDALRHADDKTLLLMDEVAAGTDPDQGAAIAQAALEHLASRRVATMTTTHYERLKLLAAHDARFRNASVGFDFERLEPTFRVQLGVPGASGAMFVARRMDVPGEVVDRAEALLGSKQRDLEQLLAQIDRERRDAQREKEDALSARAEADAREQAARALETDLQERLARLRRSAHDQVVEDLRRARVEIDEIRKAARKAARPGELPVIQAKLGDVGARVASLAGESPRPAEAAGPPVALDALKVGATVRVRGLGVGRVLEEPRRGRVTVSVGSARTTVAVADVTLAGGRDAREERRARGAKAEFAGDEAPAHTLDVRGNGADDAVGELERFLNDSYLSSQPRVRIVHGHGTGSLKAAVRGHLERHPLVAGWKPAETKEGGDGTTVVDLDV